LKHNKTNNFETINIENFSYGKLGMSYDEIDSIANIFKINKKKITSSVYDNSLKKNFPINDNTFNYIFFGDNKKQITKKAILYVKPYFYEGKKKYFAYRIE
jgi:hypothetical protein